jgi:hypothetical protein
MIPGIHIHLNHTCFNQGSLSTSLPNKLVHNLRDNLMVMVLLQPANHHHRNNPIDAFNPDREATPMNRILIRRRAAAGTLQRKLGRKRRLQALRAAMARNHLIPHQPARHPPPQHRIPLPPHPHLIVGHRPGLRRALEDHVRLAVRPRQRDRDQRRFALVGG